MGDIMAGLLFGSHHKRKSMVLWGGQVLGPWKRPLKFALIAQPDSNPRGPEAPTHPEISGEEGFAIGPIPLVTPDKAYDFRLEFTKGIA